MDNQNHNLATEQPEHRPPSPVPNPQNRRGRKRPLWRDSIATFGIFLAAILVAAAMIALVFQSYEVDGSSMVSTLHNNDRLIVWKVPVTWSHITSHSYVPGRGDIIVFNESGLSEFGDANSKQLIKRVIGLPGDRLVIKGGKVNIYNKAHPHGFDPDTTLPYRGHIPPTSGNVDLTLGPHQLFVCGDNRPNSLDSRAFGPISTDQIVGKLVLRLFPLGQAKTF